MAEPQMLFEKLEKKECFSAQDIHEIKSILLKPRMDKEDIEILKGYFVDESTPIQKNYYDNSLDIVELKTEVEKKFAMLLYLLSKD